MKRLLLLLSLFFTFFSISVYAEEIPSSPPSNGVYDPHGYLNQDVIDKVGELNKEWSETTLKPQIAVAIIDSLDKDIESVANETARAWKVGYSGTDNGILLVIAIKDKKIRTETSNNLSTLIDEEIEDKVYKAISLQLAKGLLETEGLELIYVKSEPYEPNDLSIMCEYGMAEMFDKKNWLPHGNRLGKMLMDIREELKGKMK